VLVVSKPHKKSTSSLGLVFRNSIPHISDRHLYVSESIAAGFSSAIFFSLSCGSFHMSVYDTVFADDELEYMMINGFGEIWLNFQTNLL
jgi:hypothetical protein